MSVAQCLGLDDPDGPPLTSAAVAWQRWCHEDPDLAVVGDLSDLPRWTRVTDACTKDATLARLHAMAVREAEAAVVLAWLLLPGAGKLAGKLADLSDDIDVLVAGAIWIRVRTRPAEHYVAATVLRDVRRAVLAELGVGDPARRADPVWLQTSTYAGTDRLQQDQDLEVCAASESGFLVQAAVLQGAITSSEADLLLALAQTAGELGTPARRGRAGLTAPTVIDAVTGPWPQSTRSVRRQVTDIARRLSAFTRDRHVVDDLHDFVATHDLPPVELAEFLELYLWDHIGEYIAGYHETA